MKSLKRERSRAAEFLSISFLMSAPSFASQHPSTADEQSTRYIGRTREIQVRGAYRFTQIEPLIRSDETGRVWVARVEHPRSLFRRRGLVHWHSPPTWAEPGILCEFDVEAAFENDRAEKSERYQVRSAARISEIVDLRDWVDKATLRSVGTSVGLPLQPAPLGTTVFLWTEDARLVGPLTIKRQQETNRWRVSALNSSQVEVHRVSANDLNHVDIGGGRLFLPPSTVLGASVGFENWGTDAEVARAVLRRLRKMNRPVAEALRVVDRVFLEYLEAIRRSDLGQRDTAIERARGERLAQLRTAVERDVTLLNEAVQSLMEDEKIQRALTARVEQEFKTLLAQRRQEIEEATADAKGRLTSARQQALDSEQRARELTTALENKQKEVNDRAAKLEEEFRGRIRDLVGSPGVSLAEFAALQQLMNPPRFKNKPDRVRKSLSTEHVRILTTLDELRTALGQSALKSGLDALALLDLHASFLAGGIPIVGGESAWQLLVEYSKIIANGRVHWLPISPAVIEPQDILGRFEPSLGRIQPHPAELLTVILEAQRSDDLHVVVFDGFNRAAVESYLSPLLETATPRNSRDVPRKIGIAAESLVSDDDPYRDVCQITWPPNILLALVPSYGLASLGVPRDFLSECSLIRADRSPPAGRVEPEEEPSPSYVSATQWSALSRTCCESQSFVTEASFKAVLSVAGDRPTDIATRLYSAFRANSISTQQAMRQTLALNVAPQFAGSVESFSRALQSQSISQDESYADAMRIAAKLVE